MKAKEEAEDLAQEMAELRYQLTLQLDEERKRRASIEHLSLQRISELEAQVSKLNPFSNQMMIGFKMTECIFHPLVKIVEERKKSSSPRDLVLCKQ